MLGFVGTCPTDFEQSGLKNFGAASFNQFVYSDLGEYTLTCCEKYEDQCCLSSMISEFTNLEYSNDGKSNKSG